MSLPTSPDAMFPELFLEVQRSGLFPDSKTFVDLVPTATADHINQAFTEARTAVGFDLADFVPRFFKREILDSAASEQGVNNPIEHIEQLWSVLKRPSDQIIEGSSCIPLPNPYIVPGGRFNEIYYWDSYFTQLGLVESGEIETVRHMVENFAHLIETLGFIPNGNRSYFATRSQPPFFALMVELLANHTDESVLAEFLPHMMREHLLFWMDGAAKLEVGEANRRVVMTDKGPLNRYWDDVATPRQESFREDESLAKRSDRGSEALYRDLRAGAESGWDFSSRWFNGEDLSTISTSEIIPVDLNSLLVMVERVISKAAAIKGLTELSRHYEQLANQRADAIEHYFFNDSLGCYVDLDLDGFKQRDHQSLAMCFPLFAGIASQQRAASVVNKLNEEFLKPGGWVTTNIESGEQWDAPNGWAPLQWICFQGLQQYQFDELAEEGAKRWLTTLDLVFNDTGKMLEKYNVVTPGEIAGGGEYAVQDGFGWTNGTYLALKRAIET